jgi:hypothetical protein
MFTKLMINKSCSDAVLCVVQFAEQRVEGDLQKAINPEIF